jgi:hypothetical protein
MKWLSAGLIFVNFATISGLLLGMIFRGLGPSIAGISLMLGAVAAVAAFFQTADAGNQPAPTAQISRAGYRSVWLWLLAACFVMFAVRSFCWLLYLDGDELRIQSPNNLGDLALHITYIKNFANGVSLWPDNPIYVFSKLRYPAGTDLFNALLCLLHIDLAQGLIWTGLLASLATFYAFFRWGGAFGVAGFLFNGGIAGFQFFQTFKFLDYQGDKTIAWKSIPLAMFVTQRGLLYAIPAGLLLLWHWREKFFRRNAQVSQRGPLPFWIELSLYASMPLFHLHTFLALTIILVFIFLSESLPELQFMVDFIDQEGIAGVRSRILNKQTWCNFFRDWRGYKYIGLLLGCAFIPATFFVWLITDHFQAHSVLALHWGWVQDSEEFAAPFFQIGPLNFGTTVPLVGLILQKTWSGFIAPFFQFWLTNFGILIPLVLLLITQCGWHAWKTGIRWGDKLSEEVVFPLAAAAIFLFAFFVQTAPWEWDNIKIMIWAYFLVLPFLWSDLIAQRSLAARAAVCIVLFFSGFVSLFGGLAAGRPGYAFANRAEVDAIGGAIRELPVEARFAAFPIYNHPLLLQGRKVVLGYPGHLWTQGFDYSGDYQQLGELMQGAGDWRAIARHFGVRYIFWGSEEKTNYPTSTRPWEQTAKKVSYGNWGAIYDLESANQSPAAANSPR